MKNNYAVSIENNPIVSWTLFIQNPIVTFRSSGYYSVTLTVKNESGAQDTCCKVIYVYNSTSNNSQISPLNSPTKTLTYWVSIGHAKTKDFDGAPCWGLMVADKNNPNEKQNEILNYTDIYNKKGISGSEVFINSCNSYHDPWKSALVSNNPTFYIGGNKLLPQIPSNRATVAFWHDHLINGTDALTALNKVVKTYFPEKRENVYGLWPNDG